MMTTVDTSELMARYLNNYALQNIWNMPETEYRQNFIARCVHHSPQMGTFRAGPLMFKMPDSRSYYVYEVPKCCLGNLVINLPSWTRLDTWLDTNPFDFRVTGVNGEWLWRKGIYVTDYPCQSSFLMIIDAAMAQKILGKGYNFKKIYLSVYVDSDGEPLTNLRTECYQPTSVATRNEVYDKREEATFFFINGRESQPASVEDIANGDYIELVYDPDVMSDFTLDLSQVGKNHMYRSSVVPQFNYLIHIPKEDNPENYLITHNTCDVFIRPKNVPNANVKGLFIHRFNTTDRFTQITHNDFGISDILIQSYMSDEALNTTEVVLRVVARRHKKGIKLIREANYLQMLYQLTDEEIINFLIGKGDKTLPFWKAAHIEASPYAKLMFKNPLFTGISGLSGYIEALGFYNTMALVCKRVTRASFGVSNTHVFSVDLPFSMMNTAKVTPHVFINGFKVPDNMCGSVRTGQYVTITIDKSIQLKPGTEIITELFENTKYKTCYFYPLQPTEYLTLLNSDTGEPVDGWPIKMSDLTIIDVDSLPTTRVMDGSVYHVVGDDTYHRATVLPNTTIWHELVYSYDGIPESMYDENKKAKDYYTLKNLDDDFEVYEVKDALDDAPESNYFADQYNIDQTYKKIDPTENMFDLYEVVDNGDGTRNIVFGLSSYGRTFYIATKRLMSKVYSKTFKIGELYGRSITTGMLFTKAIDWITGDEIEVPVIQDVSVLAYLNQRELVKDVDYSLNITKSKLGGVCAQAVHVSNSEYLNNLDEDGQPQDNELDIYVTTDKVFTLEHGFIINGAITSQNALLFWYQELAKLSCDGRAIKDIKYTDGDLMIDGVRNGGLWYLRGLAPQSLYEMFQQYGDDKDMERCVAVLNFFKNRQEPVSNFVIQPHSHHIYSIIVNEIMCDVLNGTTSLAYDADVLRMKEQAAKYIVEDQDPALYGNYESIKCYNCGLLKLNQEYSLVDKAALGAERAWYNPFINATICFNPFTNRWELRSTLKQVTEAYYYAEDPTHGQAHPTNLIWQVGPLGVDQPPVMETGSLDLSFIDILPSYRLFDSEDPSIYRILEQLKRAILPVDDNRDIRVDQP